MNFKYNCTIQDKIIFNDISLHSGDIVKLELHSSEQGFITINGIKVCPLNILDTVGMTTLNNISQIEHIMSLFP